MGGLPSSLTGLRFGDVAAARDALRELVTLWYAIRVVGYLVDGAIT